MRELTARLAECLTHILEVGFQAPLYFAAIGINGAAVTGRYRQVSDGSLDCDILTDHMPDGQMLLPINIMFTDSRGEASRVVIAQHQSDAASVKWIN